jgi:transcriptional regulator with XRE-family HTH domain
MPNARSLFYLRPETVDAILDRHHLTHARLAAHLGLSRSYFSQLVHRHRPVSRSTRRLLLDSRYVKGVPEAELWDVLSTPIHER